MNFNKWYANIGIALLHHESVVIFEQMLNYLPHPSQHSRELGVPNAECNIIQNLIPTSISIALL